MQHPDLAARGRDAAITTLFPFLSVFLALPLPELAGQQTKVVPPSTAKTEGSTSAVYPFAYVHPRVQQVWSGAAVTSSVALINGISYRMDGGSRSAEAARAYTGVTMAIGTTTASPANLSTTFASNITSPLTTVLSGNFNLPAQAATSPTSPAPFNIPIAWTQPYVFTAAQGHLIFDITLPGPVTRSNYLLDAEFWSVPSAGTVVPFGKMGTFSKPETVTFSADANSLAPGGSVSITCGRFAASYPGTLVFGISDQNWGAVNLPLDLSVIGAPGNHLYVSMNLQLPFSTVAAGTGFDSTFKAPIPNSPIYQGVKFFSQAYYADAAANAAGLVSTQGLSLTTAGPGSIPDTNMVAHGDTTQPTGSLPFRNTPGGAVVQFSGVLP